MIQNDANGPDVHFVTVADLAVQDFGSDVVGGSANGSFFLSVKLQFGGEAEVSELDLHFFVQKEVTQLQTSFINVLPVDDPVLDQVLHGIDDLGEVTLHLQFRQPFPSFQQLV